MEDDGHPCCPQNFNFKGFEPLSRKDLIRFLFYTASYDSNNLVNYFFVRYGKCTLTDIQEVKKDEYVCSFQITEPVEKTKDITNLHITPFGCETVKDGKTEDYFSAHWRAYMYRINGNGYMNRLTEYRKQNFLAVTPNPNKDDIQEFKAELSDEKVSMLVKFAYFNQIDMTYKSAQKARALKNSTAGQNTTLQASENAGTVSATPPL